MSNLMPVAIFIISLLSCQVKQVDEKEAEPIILDLLEAEKLIGLPLDCIQQEFPNKLGQTLNDKTDLGTPIQLHPAFYGCFDWHSSVHGHWSIVKLLKKFPEISRKNEAITMLLQNISPENIAVEVEYFKRDKHYERTYGWAWLLKLAEELHTWDHEQARILEANLQPLTDVIVDKYLDFLPKLVYPVRVGTHSNTAFGLSFAYDYAKTTHHEKLLAIITQRAKDFYANDNNCPLGWEPSGYDFLSPCFEEIDIMRKVLSPTEFEEWIRAFLPKLITGDFHLKPAIVGDREDGHLVHLDGLNFSRAWVILGLIDTYPQYDYLASIAYEHIAFSLPNLIGDHYEGGHWLGSFAIYALGKG